MGLRKSMMLVIFAFLVVAGNSCCEAEETVTTSTSVSNTSIFEELRANASSILNALNIFFQHVQANKDYKAAVERNDPAGVRTALAQGADLWRRDSWGSSQFHSAAFWGSVEVLEVLKELGADLEDPDFSGNRALHIAASQGKNGAVSWLVRHGADIHAPGFEGRTPLQVAERFRQTETAALLRSLGASR